MRPTFIVMFFAVFGLMTSCVSKKKFDEMTGERDRLSQNLEETQSQLQNMSDEKDALMSEYEEAKSTMEGQISSLENDVNAAKKEASDAQGMMKEVEEKYDGLSGAINSAFDSYETSGLMLEEVNDYIYLKTSEPVLFSSGSIRLGGDDRAVIDSLASLLKNNKDLEIIIEGHTDDQGVVAGAAYRDNWDLSYRRADAVLRRLLREGVDPSQLAAAARGEYKPLSEDQSTSDARAMNRRVVFRVAPKMGDVYNMTQEDN
ncbi:MAG: OmpA family protein [Bacteroidota bacterium]